MGDVADVRGPVTGARAVPCNHGRVADRRQKTLRDMAISMGLIAVVALVLYGMYGGVSFSPGRASDGSGADRRRHRRLNRAAPLVGFPVVIPGGLPDGWNPNSFSFVEKTAAARPSRRRCGPAG